MEASKCWKIVEFPKTSFKMKYCKTFYEGQIRSRVKEIIQPLHYPTLQPDQNLLRLWNKNVLTEIYRNIQKFSFKVLQGYSSWESRKAVVQMSFLDTKQKNIGRKICKVKKVLGCVVRAYYFKCQVSWGL